MSKKDVKVELLRIIACFMVIVYHTRTLPILEDGTVSETAILIECMCAICVITFFLISGFFIYKKDNNIFYDWLHIAIGYIKTLVLIGLLVGLWTIVFHKFLVSQYTFFECIKKVNIKDVIDTFFTGIKSLSVNYWPGTCAHLWYIFSYGLIILYYPLTRLFLRLDKRIVYVVLILFAALQLCDDILIYYDYWKINVIFEYIPRPVIYSAWGHLLYNDVLIGIKNVTNKKTKIKRAISIKDIFISKKVAIVSIIMYVISFIGIFYMQYMYNTYVRGIHTYTAWYSIGSLTLSMAVMMLVMNIKIDLILSEKIKKVIYVLGGMTLGIYMLHFPIVVKLASIGFQRYMEGVTRLNFLTQMVYVVFYNLMILIMSIILLLAVRFVGNSCKMIFKKIIG